MEARIKPFAVRAIFLALTATGTAHAADYYLSEERLGLRTVPLLLLSRPDVRADLALNGEQSVAAESAIDQLYRKAEALRGKGDTPDVVAARRALDLAQEQWFETHLSETQRARLDQIDLQWEGPAALARPTVAASLALTADQRRHLATAIAERRRQRQAGRIRPEDEHHLAEQVLGLLTEPQKSAWKAMLGRPIEFKRAIARR
jgi:hypothetical protein